MEFDTHRHVSSFTANTEKEDGEVCVKLAVVLYIDRHFTTNKSCQHLLINLFIQFDILKRQISGFCVFKQYIYFQLKQ